MWVGGLVILLFVILLAILWSVKRRPRANLTAVEPDQAALIPSVTGLAQTTLHRGNAIELLHNGRFFDRLFDDLAGATRSISFETFLAKEGEVTRRLTDILVDRAGAGVEVRLLLDASGGRHYGKKDLERLKVAGCKVTRYHHFHPADLGRINQRTHRKLVVVDGRIGYVGGHCLVDTWLGDAEDEKHFRDITARVEGPLVTQMQSAFTDNWIEECGEVISGSKVFPLLEPAGAADAAIVFISPVGGPSTLKLLHYFAIRAAKHSITIQNPYFLPDPDARDALLDAVRRGVRVRIMTPAAGATDSTLVAHATHHHYGSLLRGGVRIFEYERTLLHQKVFTIDGEWCSVGSANFDDRSFEINDEISLVVFDPAIAAELERAFEEDLKHAKEWSFEHWSERSAGHKLTDLAAFAINEQL